MGYYSRQSAAINRFCQAMEDSPRVPEQVVAIRSVIKSVLKSRGTRTVVIIVRDSPVGKDDGIDASLVRQRTFLGHMLPEDHGLAIRFFGVSQVSAYKDDFVDLLRAELEVAGPRALVLSASIDRATRNVAHYEVFREMARTGSHAFMSVVWDHKSVIAPCDALALSESEQDVLDWQVALKVQLRAPLLALNLPIIQPVVWCASEIANDSHPVWEHAMRHIKDAQAFAGASEVNLSMGNRSLPIPEELAIDQEGQGLSRKVMLRWAGYAKE